MTTTELQEIFTGRRSQPDQLIEVLQDIHKQEGYLSREIMEVVSYELGVPVIEVYRVAHFYKAFRLKPAGRFVLTFCLGTACHVRNAGLLVDYACTELKIRPGEVTPDGLFSIECVNCLGACALGPIVSENGIYHHHMTPSRLRKLIETLRKQDAEGE